MKPPRESGGRLFKASAAQPTGRNAPWILLCAGIAVALTAAAAPAQDLPTLLQSVQGTPSAEPAQYDAGSGGFLRHLSAPPGGWFPAAGATGGAESAARAFVAQQGALFGVLDKAIDFQTESVKEGLNRSYVRLQQRYSGLSVFAGEMIVQTNPSGGVEGVSSDIMTDTELLETGAVSLTPSLTPEEAQAKAVELLAGEHLFMEFQAAAPELMLYDPAVVGNNGGARLAWRMDVVNVGAPAVAEAVFVDAHSGEVVFRYPLLHNAKFRIVFDQDNSTSQSAVLVLRENDPLHAYTSVADANLAWEYLGDTYDFYKNNHNRDSIDGCGMAMTAIVRYCEPNNCPYQNAGWSTTERIMIYGDGFAVDDVTAHELTHGVTQFESNLIYANQSGAINESFSDSWGEWVDLGNTSGNDTPAARWLMGEDLPASFFAAYFDSFPPAPGYAGLPALRSMKKPPDFQYADENNMLHPYPDRLGSPDFYKTTEEQGGFDFGGVHINCTVGDKLVYLLTDGSFAEPGGAFNGHTVSAMHIQRAADLFYEVQANLLTSGADYMDLYHALRQAALNLDFTPAEQANIDEACRAVEITGFAQNTDLSLASASFIGQAAGDRSGWSVANVGDVNGDGLDDFAIGAPQNTADDPPGPGAGKAYLFLGKAAGWTPRTSLADADAIFLGEQIGDSCGASVAGAGDVDGDGFDDFLIGAPLNAVGAGRGKAYLILGRGAADWGTQFSLSGADAAFTAEGTFGYAGRSVAGAGDADGDGLDDILIGAPYAGRRDEGDPVTYGGKAYLILGKDLQTGTTSLANASASFWAEEDMDNAGWSVAGAGDVNGDGFDDFLIGAPGSDDSGADAGQSYIIFGKSSGWSPNADLSFASASFQGEAPGDLSGSAVSMAGDVNKDGFGDILVGAPNNGGNGLEAGKAYMLLGKQVWTSDVLLSAAIGSSFLGEQAGDHAGFSVAWGGDVDGDGNSDFFIGAPDNGTGGAGAGKAYLLLGKKGPADTPCGYTVNFNLADASVLFIGEDIGDQAGFSLAGGMDVDGDGRIDDLLVGAPNNRQGGSTAPSYDGAGQTYLFLGDFSISTAESVSQSAAGSASAKNLAPVRCEVDYGGGSSSVDTVTLRRYDTGVLLGPPERMADVQWRLQTTRAAFSGAAAFHYTNEEIAGIPESSLKLFQAPSLSGPWDPVAGQSLDVRRNQIRGAVSKPGYFALSNVTPGAPSLSSAADAGAGQLRLVWANNHQTPDQYLGCAWDIYSSQWVSEGLGETWFAFAAAADRGNLPLGLTGGYFAWICSQYHDGSWFPCANPQSLILYSGTPHTPSGLVAEDIGLRQVRLTWNSDVYGTWHYQIIAFLSGTGWVETGGPDGQGYWHFVSYPDPAFMGGVANFTVPSAGQYWFCLRGAAWDAATTGQLAMAFVEVD